MMKYFIIVGEASGDLHGSHLIRAIKSKDNAAMFRFWGGDRMQRESEGLLVHYRDVTIMGFVEVLMNLRSIMKNLDRCKQQILDFAPDVVVLIDYPGFNLRIAEFCKSKGIRVVYYIAPKVWAWKESRAKKLERFVDDLLLIFPFEAEYFKKWKVRSHFVGNPLLDELAAFKPDPDFRERNGLDERPVIALLPGSRRQEVQRMLPLMLQTAHRLNGYQFVIAGAPSLPADAYGDISGANVTMVKDQTYDLLHISAAAIVCSGTATLETALHGVPQICAYAAHPVSYAIARMLVKVPFISLVNLCVGKAVIPELIQEEMHPDKMFAALSQILPGNAGRTKMLEGYAELGKLMGGPGASLRAAEAITGKT